MGDTHDLAVAAGLLGPGSDFEFLGQCFWLNHETVVARGLERVFEAGEEPLPIVMNHVGLAMHEILSPHDRGPKRLAHRLMAEAYAKQRQAAFQPLAAFDRDASLTRRARAGGNDDSLRFAFQDFVNRDLVVAMDFNVERRVDLAQPLHEIVGERVVIIDEQDHGETKASLTTTHF